MDEQSDSSLQNGDGQRCPECGHADDRDPNGRCKSVSHNPGGSLVYCGCKCTFNLAANEAVGGEAPERLTKPYKEHLRESLQTLEDYVGYLSACHDEGAEVFQLAVKDVLSFAARAYSPVTVDEAAQRAAEKIAKFDEDDNRTCGACEDWYCEHWRAGVAKIIATELNTRVYSEVSKDKDSENQESVK